MLLVDDPLGFGGLHTGYGVLRAAGGTYCGIGTTDCCVSCAIVFGWRTQWLVEMVKVIALIGKEMAVVEIRVQTPR